MTAATVVLSTWQSPRLLEIYARSPSWELMVRYEDRPEFEGNDLMLLPRWDGRRPEMVLICSVDEYDWVQMQTWRDSVKVVWVFHNNHPTTCPPTRVDVENFIVLSYRALCVWQSAFPDAKGFVICPAYTAEPRWGWQINTPWACLDRPWGRNPRQLAMIEETIQTAGRPGDFRMYGQGQPLGYLAGDARRVLEAACSAYVSPLPKWSGFGLAQHESFAAGVPVVGTCWGDLGHEMPEEYGLNDSTTVLGGHLARLCVDRAEAERISGVGLDFVAAHRTKRRMDADIQRAIDYILPGAKP